MASTRKQENSAETRRRLIEAAFELAAEGGSAAMSIQAVAERSKISRGSVAWHFGSKEGLVVAVIDEAFRWGLEFFSDRLATSHHVGIQDIIEANFALMAQPRARVFTTILLEALASDSVVRMTYAARYVELRAVYVQHLTQLHSDVGDPESLAVALLGSTLGINIQSSLDPATVDRGAATAVLQEVYVRALDDPGRRRSV